MKILLAIMTGIGFTLGVVFGLLLQLPIETYPADQKASDIVGHRALSPDVTFRSRRSLSDGGAGVGVGGERQTGGGGGGVMDEKKSGEQVHHHPAFHSDAKNSLGQGFKPETHGVAAGGGGSGGGGEADRRNPGTEDSALPGKVSLAKEKQKIARAQTNPVIAGDPVGSKPNKGQIYRAGDDSPRSPEKSKENKASKHGDAVSRASDSQRGFRQGREGNSPPAEEFRSEKGRIRSSFNIKSGNTSRVIPSRFANTESNDLKSQTEENSNGNVAFGIQHSEDVSYLSTIVTGIQWTPSLERSCPKPFHAKQVEAWRRKAGSMDVVKMEEGCGRMQNRLLTFRDASKACARYRLNTDQIQGEIFSYYLAKVLNISNIPPTVLVQVNAVASKWKTVHVDLSLAQWADSKLVVLTQFIPNLSAAHIPGEFREDDRHLRPILADLGSKSHAELCELVQWSDLIVFDYITANLDRVINNMFNRQWNDQMMHNPAHNLEKFKDGSLVFFDNESGLFHGYRLLDKYAPFHDSLLHSLCVFRPSTVEVVKRLHKSGSVGQELHAMFAENEAMHRHLSGIPEKNLKILQYRLDQVYEQILRCERLYDR